MNFMMKVLSLLFRIIVGGIFFLSAYGALIDHSIIVFLVSLSVVMFSTLNPESFEKNFKVNYNLILFLLFMSCAFLVNYLL